MFCKARLGTGLGVRARDGPCTCTHGWIFLKGGCFEPELLSSLVRVEVEAHGLAVVMASSNGPAGGGGRCSRLSSSGTPGHVEGGALARNSQLASRKAARAGAELRARGARGTGLEAAPRASSLSSSSSASAWDVELGPDWGLGGK
jgi:hypothetical protein